MFPDRRAEVHLKTREMQSLSGLIGAARLPSATEHVLEKFKVSSSVSPAAAATSTLATLSSQPTLYEGSLYLAPLVALDLPRIFSSISQLTEGRLHTSPSQHVWRIAKMSYYIIEACIDSCYIC